MVNLLRVLIILMLVLSIAALSLGTKLFYQRDELKGRAHLLVQRVLELSKSIEAETAPDLTTKGLARMDSKLTEDQLKTYYRTDPQTGQKTTTGEGTMDGALAELVGRAQVQITRLDETREVLAQTQQTLKQTQDEKTKVEGELAAEKKVTKEQADRIAAQAEEIKQKADSIAQLEEAKKILDEKVQDQETKITALQDEKRDLLAAKESDKAYIKKLEKQLANRTDATAGGSVMVPPGMKGRVLVVNTNWNFVVLGLVPDSELSPMVDLIVHRDDQFVGKVRISELRSEYQLAVAEILGDWQKAPIREGDNVLY